jgi:hypothetical protein
LSQRVPSSLEPDQCTPTELGIVQVTTARRIANALYTCKGTGTLRCVVALVLCGACSSRTVAPPDNAGLMREQIRIVAVDSLESGTVIRNAAQTQKGEPRRLPTL